MLDQEDAPLVSNSLSAVAQDLYRLGITPVVDDPFQEVGVTSSGDGLEHVPTNEFASPCHRRILDDMRIRDDGRQVIQDPRRVRIAFEDITQQEPLTAADIDKLRNIRKVVRIQDS